MQKICPFCKKKKKLAFFYFAYLFLQNSHISFSIIHIYSIKYSFFPTATSLTDLTQPTQPPSHSTKLPSMKFTYPFNRATINQPPKTQIQRSIINPHNHHHQPTQIQRSKNPLEAKENHQATQQKSNNHHHHHQATIINQPKSKDPKTHLSKFQNPLETKENHRQ